MKTIFVRGFLTGMIALVFLHVAWTLGYRKGQHDGAVGAMSGVASGLERAGWVDVSRGIRDAAVQLKLDK